MSHSPHFSNLPPGGPKTVNSKMLFPEKTATSSLVVIYNIAILVVMFNSHRIHVWHIYPHLS